MRERSKGREHENDRDIYRWTTSRDGTGNSLAESTTKTRNRAEPVFLGRREIIIIIIITLNCFVHVITKTVINIYKNIDGERKKQTLLYDITKCEQGFAQTTSVRRFLL